LGYSFLAFEIHAVVAVFSFVSVIWKANYGVDFLEIEFLSQRLTLGVAQTGIVTCNIIIAHLKVFKAGIQHQLSKSEKDARLNDQRLFLI
jgi:hypothetical protein